MCVNAIPDFPQIRVFFLSSSFHGLRIVIGSIVQRGEGGGVIILEREQNVGTQKGGGIMERSKWGNWKKERFDRRFYRSEVIEDELEPVMFDFRRLSRLFCM